MKTQISRYLLEAAKNYSGVYQQQGRMLTDADWNALVDTVKDRLTRALDRVVGSGAPENGGVVDFVTPGGAAAPNFRYGHVVASGVDAQVLPGYQVRVEAAPADRASFDAAWRLNSSAAVPTTITGPGVVVRTHLFRHEAERIARTLKAAGVDAPRVEPAQATHTEGASVVARDLYANQAGLPAAGDPPAAGTYYVDVWERPVLSIEDPTLLDPGLHGADTTTRTQVLAQVKWAPNAAHIIDPQERPTPQNPSKGNLRFVAAERTAGAGRDAADPCAVEVDLEATSGNYLFRVEVHEVGPRELSLKWSSENGSEAYLVGQEPDEFEEPGWVFEFFNDATEKHLGIHLNASVTPARGQIYAGQYPTTPPPGYPFVRRWDGCARLTFAGSAWSLAAAPAGNGPGIAPFHRGGALRRSESAESAASQGDVSFSRAGTTTTVRVYLDSIHWSLELADDLTSRAMAGDYWLAMVRGNAAPGHRVAVASAEPAGIQHRYLRLLDVVGGAVQPPPGGADGSLRRRLSFPPFADLNLEPINRLITKLDRLFDDALAILRVGGNGRNGRVLIFDRNITNPNLTGANIELQSVDGRASEVHIQGRDAGGEGERIGESHLKFSPNGMTYTHQAGGDPEGVSTNHDVNLGFQPLGSDGTTALTLTEFAPLSSRATLTPAELDLRLLGSSTARVSATEGSVSAGGGSGGTVRLFPGPIFTGSLGIPRSLVLLDGKDTLPAPDNRDAGSLTLRVANASGLPVETMKLRAGTATLGATGVPGSLAINQGGTTAAEKARLVVQGPASAERLELSGSSYDSDMVTWLGMDIATVGTVVVLDPSAGGIRPSQARYDRRVVGVVTGFYQSGLPSGPRSPGVLVARTGDNSGRSPVAMLGKVPCLVDATVATGGGPIAFGDLLTTSAREGYAMKADPGAAFGALLGKALEARAAGTGTIMILVTLG
jgi:hypothetical protein